MNRKSVSAGDRSLTAGELLTKALAAKKRARPGTSLRVLAQQLKCSPAFLSKVLSGKAKVPTEKIEDYAKAFDLDEYSRRALGAALASEKLGTMKIEIEQVNAGKRLGKQLLEFEDLKGQRTHEKVLGAWYHLAILDLMTCTPFESDAAWIARELGLTTYQVQTSLELLREAGLAEAVNGRWVKTNRKINFPTSRSTEVVRGYQKQVLSRAIKKLTDKTEQEDFDLRLITSASIAVNSSKIPEAKARLMAALNECIEILTDGECDQVYSLGIQLFPQQTSKRQKP